MFVDNLDMCEQYDRAMWYDRERHNNERVHY